MIIAATTPQSVLDVRQAAKELGLSTGRIRQLLLDEDSKLLGFKVGGIWGITRKDLERFKKLSRPPGNPNFQKK